MKKILVVIDNLNRGGVASVVLNISESMDKNKFSFDYVTYKYPSNETLIKLEEMNSKFFIIDRLSKTSPIKYMNSIRRVIRENGPYDAIHAHTSSFIWLACLAGKKEKVNIRIGHAHGSKNVKQFLFSETLYSLLRILNRRYCTNMLTCAESSAKYVFGKNYEFIPNFVDYTQYTNMSVDEKNDFLKKYNICNENELKKYCFIGYLGGEKNPMFAVELFKNILYENQNSIFLIAGDGPQYKEIIEYIRNNNIENKVIMFGNTDKVKEILQISDIMLMPSYSEGMSIAALEAQISGVHCIVSKGVPDTNDIKVGLYHQCERYEINEWLNTIEKVITTKKDVTYEDAIFSLQKIGYDRESIIKKLERIYLHGGSES